MAYSVADGAGDSDYLYVLEKGETDVSGKNLGYKRASVVGATTGECTFSRMSLEAGKTYVVVYADSEYHVKVKIQSLLL